MYGLFCQWHEAGRSGRQAACSRCCFPGCRPPADASQHLAAAAMRCRAKEYSRQKMQQHREWQKDLTTKLKLKQAAIAALPEGFLRDAALVEDTALFPGGALPVLLPLVGEVVVLCCHVGSRSCPSWEGRLVAAARGHRTPMHLATAEHCSLCALHTAHHWLLCMQPTA